MPFDQHYLGALVAPRKLCIVTAEKDTWADTDAQFLACLAASPAWECDGKKGFVCPDRLPQPGDFFREGEIAFHLREGTHFFSRDDWRRYLDLI